MLTNIPRRDGTLLFQRFAIATISHLTTLRIMCFFCYTHRHGNFWNMKVGSWFYLNIEKLMINSEILLHQVCEQMLWFTFWCLTSELHCPLGITTTVTAPSLTWAIKLCRKRFPFSTIQAFIKSFYQCFHSK